MGQGKSHLHIWPAVRETFNGFVLRHVQCVTIRVVDLGKSFDQVSGVRLVSSETRTNRMSVYRDVQTVLLQTPVLMNVNEIVFTMKPRKPAILSGNKNVRIW